MGRILFWLVIIFIVIMVYRLLTTKRRDPVQPKQVPSTSLEACPHCGIHMPHTELIAHIKDTHV